MTKDKCSIKEKVIRLKGLLAYILHCYQFDEEIDDTHIATLIDTELNHPTPKDLEFMIQLRKRILSDESKKD